MAAAIALDAYVVTNDALMRAKLRREGIKCIFLRSRSHLYLENDQLSDQRLGRVFRLGPKRRLCLFKPGGHDFLADL